MGPWQEFLITDQMRKKIVMLLATKTDVFTFETEPLLASLIACLGLQFEIGKPEWDRLSPALGVEGSKAWKTQVVICDGHIGIRMWMDDNQELLPRHEDFKEILHPLSLLNGRLCQVVIFPALVAKNYQQRGLNLVIVKDWVLSTFLSESALNYLKTNFYEIENNSAKLQIQLMSSKSISFSGTHDLADHLLGGHEGGFDQKLLSDVDKVYQQAFSGTTYSKRKLVISYLIGIVLDDLAQPVWYNSSDHRLLLKKSLALFSLVDRIKDDINKVFLPDSFNELIKQLRAKNSKSIYYLFDDFSRALGIFC